MIVDAESLDLVNAIESLLEDAAAGEIKPELHGVGARDLDRPVRRHARRPARSCARCAPRCAPRAAERGLTIGSAGTHPFARWEDQRIVARPRYRDLISRAALRRPPGAIFGMHVHVGVDDPDKAIHVANGMRVHLAVLLALSGQLALLARRRDRPGLDPHPDLPRLPARRDAAALPRLGRTTSARSRSWSTSGVMEDYTYLWYDVRPHPNFGTVEIRVMRLADPRRAHAGAGRARPGPGQGARPRTSTPAARSRDYPWQMLDENKWLAARHGLEGELVDLPSSERVATKALARRLLDRLREHAAGPRLGRRARGRSTTCWSAATARRARWSSTRPTTTCAR